MNEQTALNNVHITLNPGETLGICGPTGSGKSTLLNLIQKQFDIKDGEMLYNDISSHQVKTQEWRSLISVVNQISFLFSDTIANNIALGKPHASLKEIEKAAHLANIHKDIMSFSKGYYTQIGEKGIMLSGGQKQRIAIARAILTNRKILILDDALSAVDGETQNIILKNIYSWKKNKHTLIITSHRLSTLTNSDHIIVLQSGEISQRGNHTTLMKLKKWYYSMYQYQQIHI